MQLQGDLPFRSIGHVVRDFCFTAAITIFRPAFRKKQFAVDQAVKIARRVAEMDRHDAILRLADRAAPLSLDARRLVSLFHVAGFVDDPDRVRPGVFLDHQLPQPTPHPIFVPPIMCQEFLQCSWGNPCMHRDRLDALRVQVRQLALYVHRQVGTRILASKAAAELLQVTSQHRLQPANLVGIHAMSSSNLVKDNRFAKMTVSRNTNLAL